MFWAKVKVYSVIAASAAVVATAAAPMVMTAAPAKPQAVAVAVNPVQLGINASLGGKRPFPESSPWNQDISKEPVDTNSAVLIASLGRDKSLFADFGTPMIVDGASRGYSYFVVGGDQPRVPVRFEWPKESDPGPYPLPPDLPVDPLGKGNRYPRAIALDRDAWKLYELGNVRREGPGWRADIGAVWDLSSNSQRLAGWTSADAAGMPIFPGLIRYDEVGEQKAIRHALRFSASRIRAAYVAPARHCTGSIVDPGAPPMGMRVRLRADVDLTDFPPEAQVILTALKSYGMFLGESGTDWYLSGVPDPRWNEQSLKALQRVKGRDFEVVRMGDIQAR